MSKILTFEEYVKEGLISKTLMRSKSSEKRREDEILEDSNLYELESVDIGLPFYFANDDLLIGDECVFSMIEFGEMQSKIEKTGWRLPTVEDLKNISKIVNSNKKDYFYHATNFDYFLDTWVVTYKPTDTDLNFVLSIYTEYMLNDFKTWRMSNYKDNECLLHPDVRVVYENDTYKIRLIKDKK